MSKFGSLAVILDRLNEYGEIEISEFEFGSNYYELTRTVLLILNQLGEHYSFKKSDDETSTIISIN